MTSPSTVSAVIEEITALGPVLAVRTHSSGTELRALAADARPAAGDPGSGLRRPPGADRPIGLATRTRTALLR
ncbi:hypothetical protein [Streptomyces sp. NPDC090083]|uniref:hypothetical protein n=1 Tax=Streptomyces sp. NPDC090083 TaxID=3365941 RepID=UPI00381D6849